MALSGCLDAGLGARTSPAVVLSEAGLSVGGPSGYCVNPPSVIDSDPGAFVVLTNCAALEGRPTRAQAVLTFSASGELSDPLLFNAAEVAGFFNSERGRAALSRRGDAGSVTVLAAKPDGETVIIHAVDRAPPPMAGLAQDYWRALYVDRDRLMTLTLTSVAARPMPPERSEAVIAAFVARMKALNAVTPAAEDPEIVAKMEPKAGFFARLLKSNKEGQ